MHHIPVSIHSVMLSSLLFTGIAAQGQEKHQNLQAVTGSGTSAWVGSHPFTMRGVLLNDPEEMLDATWLATAEDDGVMGGQWQVFFQTVAADDRGGTACWMGQNYNSLGPFIPGGNAYNEEDWTNEIHRVSHDPDTGRRFRKGDLVEVTARQTLFYGGKRNINENHRTTAANNFDIVLIEASHGLPDPEVITLADLITAGTNQIFDATRQTGGEFYQAMRVHLDAIRLTTNYFGTNGWSKTAWEDRLCTVTDGQGRYLHVRMPLTDLGPMPDDWFSATGILNQESGSGTDGTHGYQLFLQEIGPTLHVARQGSSVQFFWSATFTNYVLESTTDLTETSSWQRVDRPAVKWLAVEVPASEQTDPARAYRLIRKEP